MSRFSTKQVVVMVVSVCAAVVLAPAAVIATTGSAVNITDPLTSSSKARVDAGALRVDGTVNDRPLGPTTPWHANYFLASTNAQQVLFSGVGTTRLTITSIGSRNTSSRQSAYAELQQWVRPGGNTTACDKNVQLDNWVFKGSEHLTVPVDAGQQLTYPTGWVITAARSQPYCLLMDVTSADSAANLYVDIDGYRS